MINPQSGEKSFDDRRERASEASVGKRGREKKKGGY